LALAWLLHKDSKLIPIPGTQNIHHLEDNIAAADVVLSAEQMQQLDALINPQTVKGPRYNALNASEVDTEEFA
jgi:aryl-alcohol dehydrogenase-like predicted oxidoreductase